jgi:hypothetical protein
MRTDIGGKSRVASPSRQAGRGQAFRGDVTGGGGGIGWAWESNTPEWRDQTGNVIDPGTGGGITGRFRRWSNQEVDLVSVRVVFGTSYDLGDGSPWVFGFPQFTPDDEDLWYRLAWADDITPIGGEVGDNKTPDGWGGVATFTSAESGSAPNSETAIFVGTPYISVLASDPDLPGFGITGYGLEMAATVEPWSAVHPFQGTDLGALFDISIQDGMVLRASVYGRFIIEDFAP